MKLTSKVETLSGYDKDGMEATGDSHDMEYEIVFCILCVGCCAMAPHDMLELHPKVDSAFAIVRGNGAAFCVRVGV